MISQQECLYHVLEFLPFVKGEDGIRDGTVTGVQTCALPILFFTTVLDNTDNLRCCQMSHSDTSTVSPIKKGGRASAASLSSGTHLLNTSTIFTTNRTTTTNMSGMAIRGSHWSRLFPLVI